MALIKSLDKKEVDPTAQKIYEKFEKKGSVPEWVKVMAHKPKVLKEFHELFNSIMGDGEFEDELRWKIAHTVSHQLKCPFCVDVTEKMLKKFGATEKELKDIKNTKNLTDNEKEILELVKDVTENANVDNPDLFKKLREKFTNKELVEIVSVIGLFNYINRFNNTFGILPE